MINYIPRKVSSQSTRHGSNAFVVHHGSLNSFRHCAVNLWNSLQNHIRNSDSKEKLKSICKNYLFNIMKQEDCDFIYY